MSESISTKTFHFRATGVESTVGQLRQFKSELSSTLTFSTQLINTLTILGLPRELREAVRFLQKLALAANVAAASLEAFRLAVSGGLDVAAAARLGMYITNASITLGMMMME